MAFLHKFVDEKIQSYKKNVTKSLKRRKIYGHGVLLLCWSLLHGESHKKQIEMLMKICGSKIESIFINTIILVYVPHLIYFTLY